MDLSQTASTLLDFTPTTATFLEDVRAGMAKRPRHLPCKYLYDERGSRLFEEICGLPEYYPTRTELAIMRRHGAEMAAQIGAGVMLVEYGSGSGMKTRILLDNLQAPVAYVPVDISREHLAWTADRLALAYPGLEVLPVCADFTDEFHLPTPNRQPTHTAVYFPGSTIGNFHRDQARALMEQIVGTCGAGGGLLLGVDLQKEAQTLEAAYNDRKGVTAQFNLNLLRRINRELDADFDLASFRHEAVYNPEEGRVELYLVSHQDQEVSIAGEVCHFEAGERICTEYSYKHTIGGFAEMAGQAGLELRKFWTDELNRFAVLHLAVSDRD